MLTHKLTQGISVILKFQIISNIKIIFLNDTNPKNQRASKIEKIYILQMGVYLRYFKYKFIKKRIGNLLFIKPNMSAGDKMDRF